MPPSCSGGHAGESCNRWNAGAPLVILDDGKLSGGELEA